MAAVVEARDRLLAGIAAFPERDRPLDEAGLGRKDSLVDLAPETRCRRANTELLEVGVRQPRQVGWRLPVEDLGCRNPVVLVGDAAVALADDEVGAVLLEPDLRLRREAHP